MAFAYLDPDGSWSFREAFPCVVEGSESWPRHPWTTTDPTLPTYQDCPRCGARRIRVPNAFASGPHGRDRRGVVPSEIGEALGEIKPKSKYPKGVDPATGRKRLSSS